MLLTYCIKVQNKGGEMARSPRERSSSSKRGQQQWHKHLQAMKVFLHSTN